jgi:hypothetical protein
LNGHYPTVNLISEFPAQLELRAAIVFDSHSAVRTIVSFRNIAAIHIDLCHALLCVRLLGSVKWRHDQARKNRTKKLEGWICWPKACLLFIRPDAMVAAKHFAWR